LKTVWTLSALIVGSGTSRNIERSEQNALEPLVFSGPSFTKQSLSGNPLPGGVAPAQIQYRYGFDQGSWMSQVCPNSGPYFRELCLIRAGKGMEPCEGRIEPPEAAVRAILRAGGKNVV
jgi:hypothetical protein